VRFEKFERFERLVFLLTQSGRVAEWQRLRKLGHCPRPNASLLLCVKNLRKFMGERFRRLSVFVDESGIWN